MLLCVCLSDVDIILRSTWDKGSVCGIPTKMLNLTKNKKQRIRITKKDEHFIKTKQNVTFYDLHLVCTLVSNFVLF